MQGLRAIAILLALVYHAGIPPFTGGYVGIEVFFVISGFVITGLLLRERTSTGHTSLRNFYGRRARRIIPMATLVIIVTVIATYHSLGTLVGHETAVDGKWAALFLGNVHYEATDTNYLVSQAPPSPLLNYWSLGVEEQFYIVYPAVFLFLAWWARRGSFRMRLTVFLVAVIVASYAYSIVFTASNAQSAYFSLPVRSWELALGALIAVHSRQLQRIPQSWAAIASWVGLAVILISSVTLTPADVYPGALVAIPTLAAGLVIAAGAAAPTWGVERLLRLQPFPFLALISFSLYLWHWPVLEIAAQSRGVTTLPAWDNVLLLLFSTGLAALTYKFIENPIRQAKFLSKRRWASLVMGFCLVVASLTVITVETHLHDAGALATPGLANLGMGDSCPAPTQQQLATWRGGRTSTNHRVAARVLLVGDSTACTMLPGLAAVGAPVGVDVEDAAVIGCGVVSGEIAPRLVNGSNVNRASSLCQTRAIEAENRALRSGRPNVVVWASSWEREALLVGSGNGQKVLEPGSAQWYSVLQKRMQERVRQFTSTGATVVMLTQPPFVLPGNLASQKPQDESFERLNTLLTDFATRIPRVRVVDLAAQVCPSGPPCPILVDNIWVRGDGEHYTTEGSVWVARWLMPQLGIRALDKSISPLPEITVVAPSRGAVVKGTRPIAAVASFNIGVARVEFQVSGGSLTNHVIGFASFKKGFWGLYWHTGDVPNGTYVLRSVVFNSAGDRSIGKDITVRVAN